MIAMNEINIINIDDEYIGEINRIFALNENRGVVTNYFDYAWEICEALSKSKPIMIDSDILKYEIENYKIQREDCFFINANIRVFISNNKSYQEEKSEEFNSHNNVLDLNGQLKLNSFDAVIRIYDSELSFDRNKLLIALTHEMQHAYRYLSILRQNNGTLPQEILNKSDRYQRNRLSMADFDKSKESSVFLQDISIAIYSSEETEISAYCAEAREFIRQNKYITSKNYTNYLMEFEMYKRIIDIKYAIIEIDKKVSGESKDFYKSLLKIKYDNYFANGDYSEEKCAMLFRQFLIKRLVRAEEQFYKTIKRSLEDYDRVVKENIYPYGDCSIIKLNENFRKNRL